MTAVALAPICQPAIEIDDYLVLTAVTLAPVEPAPFLPDPRSGDLARDNTDADLPGKQHLGDTPDGHSPLLHKAMVDEGTVGTGVLQAQDAIQEKEFAMVT